MVISDQRRFVRLREVVERSLCSFLLLSPICNARCTSSTKESQLATANAFNEMKLYEPTVECITPTFNYKINGFTPFWNILRQSKHVYYRSFNQKIIYIVVFHPIFISYIILFKLIQLVVNPPETFLRSKWGKTGRHWHLTNCGLWRCCVSSGKMTFTDVALGTRDLLACFAMSRITNEHCSIGTYRGTITWIFRS